MSEAARVGAPDRPPSGTDFKAITLDRIDPNLFLAKPENLWKPPGARAVFGGQVLGQSVAAASQTVAPGLALHSLHAYFVRAGQPQHPIIYDVKRVNDGNSFATRAVAAKQDGEWIFMMQASFHRPEKASFEHQATMPVVVAPETLPTEEERNQQRLGDPNTHPIVKKMVSMRIEMGIVNPIDVRVVIDSHNVNSEEVKKLIVSQSFSGMGMPTQMMWFRARNRLPDDAYVHHAVIAYQSDSGLLGTIRQRVPLEQFFAGKPMMASLDHAMWFHHPFPTWRADEWLLYVMYSPKMSGARGLAHGHIYSQDGRLVVSCTQEGLVRLGSDREKLLPPDPTSKL